MSGKKIMNGIWKRIKRRTDGFTLVELIVVLVILSILSAVAVPAVTGYIDDSRVKECQSQREALASEIATAKMSYEIDGADEDGKGPFDVSGYIEKAGDLGHCPIGAGDPYTYKEEGGEFLIHCEKHGDTPLTGSGKFSVASVEEDKTKRESEPETQSKSDKKHSYRVEISPGALKNMETGDTETFSAKVYDENGEEVPADKIKDVTWEFSSEFQGKGEGTSASVEAKKAGRGSITCTVTVEDENGTSTAAGVAEVEVTNPKATPHIPDQLDVKAGETKNLGVTVTDEKGNNYPGEVTVTYKSTDEGKATVDENGNVTGVTPGSCEVTVTVTDENGNVVGEKNVTINVSESESESNKESESDKSNGGILKKSAQLWAEDHGGDSTFNIEPEEFASWFNEPPQGQYGVWEYKGNDGKITIYQGNEPGVHGTIEWKGGEEYVLTYTPPGGEPEEIVLTVGHTLREIGNFATNSEYKVRDTININPVIQPPNTTDRIHWEINWWEGDQQPVELTVIDDAHVSLKAVAPGKFTVRAFATTERYGTLVEQVSNVITINPNPNPGIAGVTLSPNPLSLTVGESQTVTAELAIEEGCVVDPSKVIYKFSGTDIASVAQAQQSDNTAVVTGNNEGNPSKIKVEIYYDGLNNWITYAECDVTVLKEGEVLIDGQRFKATSWEEFQKAVVEAGQEDNTYKVNKYRGETDPSKRDSPLYYDIATGELYVLSGNSTDFKTTKDTGKEIPESKSFEDYIGKSSIARERFAKVNLEDIKEYTRDQLEQFAQMEKEPSYPMGTVVKIKEADGTYTYYVVYIQGNEDSKLSSILKE